MGTSSTLGSSIAEYNMVAASYLDSSTVLGSVNAVIATYGAVNISDYKLCSGTLGCEGTSTITHSNAFLIGTNGGTSNGDNTVIVANLEGALTDTCDPKMKRGLKKSSAEDLRASDICSKFKLVETKEYNLKNDPPNKKPRHGFDADNLQEYFPEVVETHFERSHKCERESEESPWTCDTIEELNQNEVIVSDSNPLKGVFYTTEEKHHKSVNILGLCKTLWVMCKKQQELIESLEARVDTLGKK